MEISNKDTFKKEAEKGIEHLSSVLSKLRTGVADNSIVRNIQVSYFGDEMDLYQIANISTPEPRVIQIKPYNKDDIKKILKSIQESPLEVNPTNTEDLIRITLAPLTTDQKTKVIKDAKKEAESTKIGLRSLRQRANKEIENDDELSENQQKKQKKDIQEIVDQMNKEIENSLKEKTDQINKV